MSPFGLRPDDPAAVRIRDAAARGTLFHALLFTGSGDRDAAARFAAAAHECTAAHGRPCGSCPACRKVLTGIHPDVITVRDPEHRNIAVDVVRGIRSDAYIRPNEGARKVYIFPDCGLLTEQDQNVLLALGMPHEIAHGSLRLSLCEYNTMEEVDYILEQVPQVVRELREMSPVWMHMLETMPDPYKSGEKG